MKEDVWSCVKIDRSRLVVVIFKRYMRGEKGISKRELVILERVWDGDILDV